MVRKLPKGWAYRVLGNCIESIESGVSVNGEDRPAASTETGVLKVSAVSDGRFFPGQNKKVVANELVRARLNPSAGSLIVSRANTPELVGAVAYVEEDHPNLFLSDKLWQIRLPKSGPIAPQWLNAVLSSQFYRKQLMELATGSSKSMQNISQASFLALEVPAPGLDEQRRIVCVLDAADRQIQLAEKIAHEAAGKVLAMTSSLVFQGLRSTAPFDIMKSKRLAKRGWKRTTIAQIASEVRRVNREGMALPVLSSTKQKGIVFSDDYFGKQVYSANTSTYKRVRRGEFVYATNHIEEGSIGMQDICDEGLVSPMYTVFELDESLVDPYFLIAVLKTETYRQIFSANTSASVDRRGSLRWKDFSRLPVHLPDMDLQRAVAAQIAASKRYLEICNSRLNGMREQKRGLMQQLLTGQHRLTRDLPGMEPGDV